MSGNIIAVVAALLLSSCQAELLGCGGFAKTKHKLNFTRIQIKLYTKQGGFKMKTECAPNNGYFLLPIYDKGSYMLKISAPDGWVFEPTEVLLDVDGISDNCSLGVDINFNFIGFGIIGKVYSKGLPVGPQGLEVTLSGEGLTSSRKTTTQESGSFAFLPVVPGQYQVQVWHPSWHFDGKSTTAVVSTDTVYINEGLVISGYDVRGSVMSSGSPIEGVYFVLFSEQLSSQNVEDCDPVTPGVLSQLSRKPVGTPVCLVRSTADGIFLFPSLPSGEYQLVPSYVMRDIVFDVRPSVLVFSVYLKSVFLKTPFQVHGFSVIGQVMDFQNKALPEVLVRVSGEGYQKEVITANDGSFLLDNITSSEYTLLAEKVHYTFGKVSLKVMPGVTLPPIQAKSVAVCGRIASSHLAVGSSMSIQRKVIVSQSEASNIESTSVTCNTEGKFCFDAIPGTYLIQPVVLPSETKAGFSLVPMEHKVVVSNVPVLDILFSQRFAQISGSVKCPEGTCQDISVVASPAGTTAAADRLTAEINPTAEGVQFTFKNVLPVKYEVGVILDNWCWQRKTVEVDTAERDVHNVTFIHTGYRLKSVLSHNITLVFRPKGEAADKEESLQLVKGSNTFCLRAPGVFSITPKSCYRFEKDIYQYDTSDPQVLQLTATGFTVSAVVTLPQGVSGEMSMDIRPISPSGESESFPLVKSADGSQMVLDKPLWFRQGDVVQFTPRSHEVLFSPDTAELTVKDGCPGASVVFAAQRGVFITGSTFPPTEGVQVTLTVKHSGDTKQYLMLSDNHGKYSLGPLPESVQFSVDAQLDGHRVTLGPGSDTDLLVRKLSGLTVRVKDSSNQGMQGVLVSLSGESQYRCNNMTNSDGIIRFSDLDPGVYYMRLLHKEYRFEPNSQLIQIEENSPHLEFDVQSIQVAFSISGVVRTLSGNPVGDLVVEAVGMDDCGEIMEESKTVVDGSFVVRGLMPNCTYNLSVKPGARSDLSHAVPSSKVIPVHNQDVDGIAFLVCLETGLLDLNGYVDSEDRYLNTLKVLLYQEDYSGSPIHSLSLDANHFFHFPLLSVTNQTYIIKLKSSLSTRNYHTESSSVVVPPGSEDYKHVRLLFKAKTIFHEMDNKQNMLLAPLMILLLTFLYNFSSVLAYGQACIALVKSLGRVRADEGGAMAEDLTSMSGTRTLRRR